MLDLDAYLERLGVSRDAGFAELHRAHVCAIPFENLDPHQGLPVSLAPADIERKLVAKRRGGYCFEHNLLFKAALEAQGAVVEPLLGRARWGIPPETVNPLTHLVLRVTVDGEVWLADVGFGMGTLLEPIPFQPGGAYEQSGWQFRLIAEDADLVLQTDTAEGWRDMYVFHSRAVQPVDIEVSNWFVSTRPESRFVTGLIAATTLGDGTRLALSDWNGELTLSRRRPDGHELTPVDQASVPALLAEYFDLTAFELDGDGRVARIRSA